MVRHVGIKLPDQQALQEQGVDPNTGEILDPPKIGYGAVLLCSGARSSTITGMTWAGITRFNGGKQSAGEKKNTQKKKQD